jgi:hypothetical protein
VSLFRSRDDEGDRLVSFVSAGVLDAPTAAELDTAAVQRVDASFDPAAFLAAAQSLFVDVKAAMNSGSLDKVAGRFAPPFAARTGNQLQYAVSAHQLTMASVDHVTASLRGTEALSSGDIVCIVRFDVLGRMGQVALGGNTPPDSQLASLPQRTWYETWRMSRPVGVEGPPPATVCPSCGAPASGETHCHYCNALLVDATASFRIDSIECMG